MLSCDNLATLAIYQTPRASADRRRNCFTKRSRPRTRDAFDGGGSPQSLNREDAGRRRLGSVACLAEFPSTPPVMPAALRATPGGGLRRLTLAPRIAACARAMTPDLADILNYVRLHATSTQ